MWGSIKMRIVTNGLIKAVNLNQSRCFEELTELVKRAGSPRGEGKGAKNSGQP
jgi:hypothetical protein